MTLIIMCLVHIILLWVLFLIKRDECNKLNKEADHWFKKYCELINQLDNNSNIIEGDEWKY